MNYSKKSFSVGAPASQQYRDNYEKTFGKKPQAECTCPPPLRDDVGAIATDCPRHGSQPKLAPALAQSSQIWACGKPCGWKDVGAFADPTDPKCPRCHADAFPVDDGGWPDKVEENRGHED